MYRKVCEFESRLGHDENAEVAHLVERDLAKVEVAGSTPVFRSMNERINFKRPECSVEPEMPLRVSFMWYYVYNGVSHPARRMTSAATTRSYMERLVRDIVDYIVCDSRPGEKSSARLVITSRDGGVLTNLKDGEVLHDIACPIRVMNKIKKEFPAING